MEKCYTVAETVKLTGVKSYVLRYWEDELSLPIRRNELGHRCYTQDDIQLFLNIKELKNRGLQLRAIHDLLPKLTKKEGMEVIVPEEKDKIHLLESESIEKEENETRDTLREELLENVQNFKAEPEKDSGVSGDIRTSDYSGASCQKRRRRQVAHSGCSHQETADGKKRSSCIFGEEGKKEKRSVECV